MRHQWFRNAPRRSILGGAVLALVLTLLPASVPSIAAHRGVDTVAASAAAAPALARKSKSKAYRPKTHVTTTDPRYKGHRAILSKLIKMIRHTRRGQEIRVYSWNLASRGFANALVAAHRRGVMVRVIVSEGKVNNDFRTVRRELRKPSAKKPKRVARSWARTCDRSCRGKRGIAHSKYYLFSKTGKSRNVVVSTSANATEVAGRDQWNDAMTLVGNRKIYDSFVENFQESGKDQPVKRPYRTTSTKWVDSYFYPWAGKDARGDRVLNSLRPVKCTGAKGGTGTRGRTKIRIAQDAILNDRGVEISKRLRQLWVQGCDVKIVFALLGNRSRAILEHTKRGPVPRRQIVVDWDADGVYDRYLHAKVLVISGHYGKDTSFVSSWQGSENWSGLAKISDEQGLVLRRPRFAKRYITWVDNLYRNPPEIYPNGRVSARTAARGAIDPYAIIRANL